MLRASRKRADRFFASQLKSPCRIDSPHLLILEARFYDDLADELLAGALAVLERAGATHERISVPGALELPPALAMALDAMERGVARYDGFVVLGCVIRGETSHYEVDRPRGAAGDHGPCCGRGARPRQRHPDGRE